MCVLRIGLITKDITNDDEDGDSGSRTSSIRHNGRTKYPVVEMEKMDKVFQFVSCGKRRG